MGSDKALNDFLSAAPVVKHFRCRVDPAESSHKPLAAAMFHNKLGATDNYFMGVGIAQRLARQGHDVLYVTPFETVAPYTQFTLEHTGINKQIRADGIWVMTAHQVTSIAPSAVTMRHRWEEMTREHDTDSVVLVTQRQSSDWLYRELKSRPEALAAAGITDLYQVGDCVLPQMLADVIFSGHRLAREIDSANPAVPLPFIRERTVVDRSRDPRSASEALMSGTRTEAAESQLHTD
jgi:dimethylamine/trimethylamine dehydrogenase